jgi:hypothetical protein
MRRPETIRNEPQWIVHCTKIRARALDFVEGRLSLFDTAQALNRLAAQTHAREDADLSLFTRVYGAFLGLPAGPERIQWAPDALVREDAKIRKVEARWHKQAQVAAARLVERYAWSLEARAELRRTGGSARDV